MHLVCQVSCRVSCQVSEFLDECDLLSKSQSGFRNIISTDTAVLCVSDYILEELFKGQYVGTVLVDLKKAFDTVDHEILLKKKTVLLRISGCLFRLVPIVLK